MGNHSACLHSLAEIGALLPDATALTQFHRVDQQPPHVSSVHEHLRNVQLRLIEQLSPRMALDVYKAFAALHFKPIPEVHNALLCNVLKNTESMVLPDVSGLLQARLMVQPSPDASYLSEMSGLISSTLARSKKRNIKDATYVAHILDLFVRHNLHHGGIVAEAAEYLTARVKGLSNKNLVSVVASMTRLKQPADKLFDAIVVEVLHRGPEHFELKELAQLAGSLTEIKHFDVMTDVLMDSIAVACRKRMKELTFEELVDLLWAYSHHMHFHHDAKLLESLANGLVSQLGSVKEMSGTMCLKLCEVVSSSDLGAETSCRVLEAVSARALTEIGSLNKQELLTVITGCRKSRFVCDQLLGALREAFENRSKELSFSDLCRVLNNFTSLNYHPGDELLDLALKQIHCPDDLSPTEVSRLIWSLAYFDKLTPDNCRSLFEHLQNFSRSNFNALDTQKILLSEKLIMLLNKTSDSENDEGLIPEPLRSELITTWRERIYFTRSISPFQQEVSRVLTKMNIYHEAEALIDNGDINVDFLLFLGTARTQHEDSSNDASSHAKIVLECDGPRRRSVNPPYRSLGQTLSFKKLLKAQGWTVHVICKDDWYKKSPNEQEKLLQTTLNLQ